jgi:hypothetical protein
MSPNIIIIIITIIKIIKAIKAKIIYSMGSIKPRIDHYITATTTIIIMIRLNFIDYQQKVLIRMDFIQIDLKYLFNHHSVTNYNFIVNLSFLC